MNGIINKESFWQDKQSIPHNTVTFYGDCLIGVQEILYFIEGSLLILDLILKKLVPIYFLTLNLFEISFNIIVSSMATSCKRWFALFRFSNRDYVYISHLAYIICLPSPLCSIASSKCYYVSDKTR
jgi:hypothetical protein